MPRRTLRETLMGLIGVREHSGAAHAGAVLARHAEELMRTSGVMSVGVGTNESGVATIMVGIAGHRTPGSEFPDDIEGVPVVVQEVSRAEAF